MSTHHLILGETVDFITGQTIVDTHDERARQRIARFLVEEKGYSKDDIDVRRKIELTVDGNKGTSRVDFVIRIAGRAFAVVIFGPGSTVRKSTEMPPSILVGDCRPSIFSVIGMKTSPVRWIIIPKAGRASRCLHMPGGICSLPVMESNLCLAMPLSI